VIILCFQTFDRKTRINGGRCSPSWHAAVRQLRVTWFSKMRLRITHNRSMMQRSRVQVYVGCCVVSLAVTALAGFAFVTSQARTRDIERQAAVLQTSKPMAASAKSAPAQPARNATIIARVGSAAQGVPQAASAMASGWNSASFDEAGGSRIDSDRDPDATSQPWIPPRGTWRTVCVRLCDGAITPMSFATTRDRFNADARRCERGCSSPARLFVMRPDAEHETLVDIKGQKYSDLPTAFLFRTSFDPGCTCRGPTNGGPTNRNRETVAALGTEPPMPGSLVSAQAMVSREGETQSALKTVVQAALAIAASSPYPGDGRDPLRAGRNSAGDDASGVGSGPVQGQGSLTQAEVGQNGSTATDAIALKSKSANSAKSARPAQAAIARKRARVGFATRGVSSQRTVATARAGAQRSFSSPDYWRVSYWQPF